MIGKGVVVRLFKKNAILAIQSSMNIVGMNSTKNERKGVSGDR
jgi:hypothetical protein